MKYLIIFSIGPVQEFIAAARRSRDLWYGSWMLSELSKAAAKAIHDLPISGELMGAFKFCRIKQPTARHPIGG
ncbi:MAG: hypothetical protein DYG85_15690 [Chloroflexi bacterium CFX1]|nr:hypothetical protein [Chloroflexi bacterium CFX1]MCQ3954215.1 hypothetical protein [Chloroflexota bacterium]MDL1920537.1 hypothetical protein [Chloroflexi bacterium CFX5]